MSNRQPPYLYKYLSCKGLISLLKTLNIRCSQPSSFNDPFDCTPPFKFDECSKNCIGLNKYGDTCEGYLKCVTEKCYVSCFSIQPYNLLMWGHYTDNYKGGVIKIKRDIFLLKYSKAVNYTNEIPTIPSKYCMPGFVIDENKQEIMDLLYLRKHTCWKYEKEWRFYAHIYNLRNELNEIDISTITDLSRKKKIQRLRQTIKNNKVIIPLQSDDIEAIYVGYKNDKIDQIKEIIRQKGINAKLFKISPEHNSYNLKKQWIQ